MTDEKNKDLENIAEESEIDEKKEVEESEEEAEEDAAEAEEDAEAEEYEDEEAEAYDDSADEDGQEPQESVENKSFGARFKGRFSRKKAEEEESWDCPCHGSRYTNEGVLIDNPAQIDCGTEG